MRIFKLLLIFLIIIALFSVVAGFFAVQWFKSLPIPDFNTFDQRKVIESTKIYDRTGKILLYDIYENIKRTVIPYEDIPRNVKNATVAIEDSSFYQHKGISIPGILRAFITNLKQGKIKGQGGSTITQQLAKNTLLTNEKTFTRKIKELLLSFKLEKIMTKEEILTFYLNEIPYGGSNYGVETAALSFFNKSARSLTLAEAAYLAALPQAPSYYSPYGPHKDELDDRKDVVLKRMFELGFIEEEEYDSAKNEVVNFATSDEKGIKAPHFVMYIKSYLEEKYGKENIEQEGLHVITTLDYSLQKKAEDLVLKYTKENEEKFNAKNAGLIGIDPKTGQVLVMVGSRNYFDENYDGEFNVTLAKRQPGSSFKPFVYATAFKKGYTPETIVFDLKTEFNSSCNPDGTPKYVSVSADECYQPENYDNIFRGPITLREALAQSINIPSVKTLYLTGIEDSIKTAKSMGINTLENSQRYGLTLVLGGGEVSLLEITGAYSVFANNGVKNNTSFILEIKDNKGNIKEKYNQFPIRVLEEKISGQITSILSDNKARTPAFGVNSLLYFPERQVAVKTGTTNDYRDAWVVGYTPNFALGVWCGNNDNSSMEKKVAGFIAAPLWNDFFKKVFETLPEEKFPQEPEKEEIIKPFLMGYWQGGISYKIDKISGKLATEFTPIELTEEKILTQIHNILYWVDKNNPRGDIPSMPEKDSQFFLWEEPVRKWAANQNILEETWENIPKETDNIHRPEFFPSVKITDISENYSQNNDNPFKILVETNGYFNITKTEFYFNEIYLDEIKNTEKYFSISKEEISIIETREGYLKAVVYDEFKNKGEDKIYINL